MVGSSRLTRLVFVEHDGSRAVVHLVGTGGPDLTVVDTLSRLRLAACRSGREMHLEDTARPLLELLELAGLLGEMIGQPEERKEPLGIQEGVDLGD
jgi:hypothetical protein